MIKINVIWSCRSMLKNMINNCYINFYLLLKTAIKSLLPFYLSFIAGFFSYKSCNIVNLVLLVKKLNYRFVKNNLVLFFGLILSINNVNASVTINTIESIRGNAPSIMQSASEKLGFSVNDTFYSNNAGNIKSDEIKIFDAHLIYADFIVPTFSSSDFDSDTDYSDNDGDGADPINPFIIEEVNYAWYDNNGVQIKSDRFNDTIGCGDYSMPLKLVISAKIKGNSQYGTPKESDFVKIEKTYKIATASKICYVRPNATNVEKNLQWVSFDSNNRFQNWNNKNHNKINTSVGGGYTADYIPNWGFKAATTASGGKRFPTTGFPGAKFQLLMSSAQTDYTFEVVSHNEDVVSIDQQGFVLLKTKPSGTITVRATLKRDQSIMHDYSFDPTSLWVYPNKNFLDNWSKALQKCPIEYMLSYKQLTNSPVDNKRLNSGFSVTNGYTRAIDGTLFSEWGYTTNKTYPDSKWRDDRDRYWAKEMNPIQDRFNRIDVSPGSGYVGTDADFYPDYLVCLKETDD